MVDEEVITDGVDDVDDEPLEALEAEAFEAEAIEAEEVESEGDEPTDDGLILAERSKRDGVKYF